MSEHDAYLLALARRNAAVYIAHTGPRTILLVGSVALGECDGYSDIDMICYYDALPTNEQLRAARRQIEEREPRIEVGFGEQYVVRGVTCQVGHILATSVERDIAAVLENLDVDDLVQKRLGGLLEGVPLHGEDLIRRWQARAADYPDALARAMVEHHLQRLSLCPVWYYQEYLKRRDATLWTYQLLVEAAQHLLGVLAGLNRLYFSTFQFKRMRRFIGKMRLAPDDLADRIDSLFAGDRMAATDRIEDLTLEVIALVTHHIPQADLSTMQHRPNERDRPWSLATT